MTTIKLSDEDDDVLFLMDIAKAFDTRQETIDYAVRIRQIASRMQEILDGHELSKIHSKIDSRRRGAVAPDLSELVKEIGPSDSVNYVGKLNELCMAVGWSLPEFVFMQYGDSHKPSFRCELSLHAGRVGENYYREKYFGVSGSKKESKRIAAYKALVDARKVLTGEAIS